MDLIQRSADGRLDSLAACKLLWSGALRVERDDATWDGTSHTLPLPTIDDGVITLYGLSHEDVEASLADFRSLLEVLDGDEELRVAEEHIHEAVRPALLAGGLTGASLFLLQGGSHPLIVEAKGPTALCVRLDERLERGIPNLQGLICRMLCHLRLWDGDEEAFDVEFAKGVSNGSRDALLDFQGQVAGAERCQSTRIAKDEVRRVEQAQGAYGANAPHADDAEDKLPAQSGEARLLKAAYLLETSAYVTEALEEQANQRLQTLGDEHEKLMASQPKQDAKPRKNPTPGLLNNKAAIRSLGIRSVIYLAIGIAFLLAGRACLTQSAELSRWLMGKVGAAFAIAGDFTSLIFGQMKDVGASAQLDSVDPSASLGIPPDAAAGAVRTLGYVLMLLGILFPIRKIYKRKRFLDRELAHTQSHVAYFEGLAQKSALNAEAAYAQTLETWSRKLKDTDEESGLAKDTSKRLATARRECKGLLDKCYESAEFLPPHMRNLAATCTLYDYLSTHRCKGVDGPDGAMELFKQELAASRAAYDPNQASATQPSLRAAERERQRLTRSIEHAPSAKGRHQLMVDHCDKTARVLATAERELNEASHSARPRIGEENANE
ncbi:MAG: hypothetical protein IKF78_15575 [Atopobiaceae bacterium]|nr:hypothetical protein [Atopobiaceae bacterium]